MKNELYLMITNARGCMLKRKPSFSVGGITSLANTVKVNVENSQKATNKSM